MKHTCLTLRIIIIGIGLLWTNVVTAQAVKDIKIDLEITNKPLKEVFTIIEQKGDIHFVYNEDLVSAYTNITITAKGRTVASVLTEILEPTNLRYIEQNNKIIIEKKEGASQSVVRENNTQNNQIAQNTGLITGTVLEEGTDKPVSGATVYFDGTMNVTSSDSEGNFTLDPRGNNKIQISVTAIGYSPATVKDYSSGEKLTIRLKARKIELANVTITSDDGLSRKEKLKVFKREFLGDTDNGRNCEIVNEQDIVLIYSMKTNTLKAYCDNPIIIRNRNLGYIVNFVLESFTFSGQGTFFYGPQFFREVPGQEDPKKIEKARKATYLGSRMHFIRSLWNNDLKKNNFKITRGLKDITRYLTYDNIVVSRDNKKYIHLTESVNIIYKWRKSFLYENTLGKDMFIDRNGYNDPAGVAWAGDIGDQRVGDSFPLEYDLPVSNDPVTAERETNIVASIDTLRSLMLSEKLYIHFDKPYYNSGDTIRLKTYLFDPSIYRGSEKSGIVYLELANDSNKVFLRRMLPLSYGLGAGNIILDKAQIPEGSYTLRAYTNLMRNFGEEKVFKKSFYISSSTQNWVVNSNTILSKTSGKDNLRLALKFNQLSGEALRMHDLEVRVLEGKKVLFRDKVKTDPEGNIDINFNLPDKADAPRSPFGTKNISIIAKDPGTGTHEIAIPIPVNRPENIDLQFMPEGGNLVADIPARVGFKAIGEDGNAAEVSGKVYSSTSSQEITAFGSSYKGMGSFEMTPKGGEKYIAQVVLNGITKVFALPAIKSTGTSLRITNPVDSGWLEVTVSISSNIPQPASYYLVGQSGGVIAYNEMIRFDGNTVNKEKLDKNLFPTGIARFTLMTADRQPLNERIVYIDHHDQLNIAVTTDKGSYGKRDSIALAITVTDQKGDPVQGSFSLAVTDDSQVRTDSLSSNILTSLLLTSELKGTVEEPGHYLLATGRAWRDLDHLLLTQGWLGYDWKDVFNPPAVLQYPAEPEFTIRGKVSTVLNKGLEGTSVQLASLRPVATKSGITGKDGSFSFSGLPMGEDLKFFLQARNKNYKTNNVGIEMEEFKAPQFMASKHRFIPWYVNSDTTLLKQAGIQVAREARTTVNEANMLQEVLITEKKIVKDSKNLNGPGEADQVIDQKELAKTPKKTLLDLMREKVPTFIIGVWPGKSDAAAGLEMEGMGGSLMQGAPLPTILSFGAADGTGTAAKGGIPLEFHPVMSYLIFGKEMRLIIDGVDIENLYVPTRGNPYPTNRPRLIAQKNIDPAGNYILERNTASPNDRREFVKQFLDGILAEDIKGIEVMYNPKYNARYKSQYAGRYLMSLSSTSTDLTYVEVTTFSGNGAYIGKTPGRYLFKPMPFTNSAAFYRPRYINKTNPFKDMRSTIHWEPNIITDKEGKAVVSFYSADIPGTYSVILEGSNMNGIIGRKTGTIKIKN